MKLYLLRHGESLANALSMPQNLKNEWMDTPLSKKGLKQANEIAKKLIDKKFDKIISSPFIRTKQTAEVIAKNQNIELTFDNRIKEYLDGETLEDFISRTQDFWNEFKSKKGEYLIVTHAAVIITLLKLSKTVERNNKKIYKEITNTSLKIINYEEKEREKS